MIRLYVEAPLAPGVTVHASSAQAHYLGTVMRRGMNEPVRLFNGQDGEWAAHMVSLSRGKACFAVEAQTRAQAPDADLSLMFAVLKRDSTDLVVQKATELGVSALLPVFTERTNASRVNEDRLRAIAIEAAEQSERLTVPCVESPRTLSDALAVWPAEHPLFLAAERAEAPPLRPIRQAAGLLIGPEGGFGPRDHAVMERCAFIRPASLGPRILRAETAAIAGLVLLQAADCG